MPTEIISELTKVFKFYDIFDNDERNYCEVTINVKVLKYDNGNQYYDVSYSYSYINETGNTEEFLKIGSFNVQRSNPFYYIYCRRNDIHNIDGDSLEGVIVVKNSMTDEMIKYLLMEYKEMNNIGTTWCVQYKVNVMHALALMWD